MVLPVPGQCGDVSTGYALVLHSKEKRMRWKYFNGDMACKCGQAPESTKYMLQCPLLTHPCTLDNLLKFNENDRRCVDNWNNAI